ncbi:RnfABCDGE type electron transport complex subunit D [Mesoaciditoga lauensis]|uniref:RnfABCDGE type electron transport complex subunit D n=1 Tax=Mesoaciditoga lauensis TaxID=1495039 RepID=UPI000560FC66|nr:RnfABCDGE type electron transport complex subunit D [Mesoaciditoga lauensis]
MKFTLGPAPHIHDNISTRKIMIDVLIALAPAGILAVLMWGWYMLLIEVGSMILAEALEFFTMRYMRKKKDFLPDGSAAVTGLLLAMNVPAGISWWMMGIGVFVAIMIGKEVFGGIGSNPFNPALVGRIFMYISFPAAMTAWPKVNWFHFSQSAFSLQTTATPLGVIKMHGMAEANSVFPHLMQNAFFGNIPGSAGEMSALALIAGFLYLWWKGIVSYEIPIAYIGTTFGISAIYWFINPSAYPDPTTAILIGGVMLGALFMATDPVTSPITSKGKWIFGLGCGVITVLIRYVGSYPEGVNFAILLMNSLVPFIDQISRPKVFGEVRKNG